MLRSALTLAPRGVVRPLLAAAVLAALSTGCRKEPKGTRWEDQPAPTASATPAPTQPAPGATAPAPHGATPPTAGATVGTVAETMDSGGYTYARLSVGGKDVWVAGPQTTLAVGTSVDYAGGALMTGFHSSTLDRTFDQIYFLSAFGGAGPAAVAGDPAAAMNPHAGGDPGAAMNPHGATATRPAPALAPGEVITPAAGGQPIAKVFADKAALAGKPVTVRGKVVKYNEGILGKNWLHVQDGTGAAGTNDLTVTTDATTTVGAVVTVRGVLALDKDVGAGYKYDVLVENATLE